MRIVNTNHAEYQNYLASSKGYSSVEDALENDAPFELADIWEGFEQPIDDIWVYGQKRRGFFVVVKSEGDFWTVTLHNDWEAFDTKEEAEYAAFRDWWIETLPHDPLYTNWIAQENGKDRVMIDGDWVIEV